MINRSTLISSISLLRPKQWVKNGFVWVPLFFTPQAVNIDNIILAVLAFAAFSCAASIIYIFNDWQDRASDRLHPNKQYRPLASGQINEKMALIIGGALLVLLLLILCFIGNGIFVFYIAAYLGLNIAYCLWLRHIALLDIAAISASFLLRLAGGITLIHADASPWIIIMTGLLALFIAAGKRRDDVVRGYDASHRQSLIGYNLVFLDSLLQILCSVLLAAYFIYTTESNVAGQYPHHELLFTTPFVVMGLMRYLQIAKVENRSGSPTELVWQDRFLQICIAGWLAVFGWLLYAA